MNTNQQQAPGQAPNENIESEESQIQPAINVDQVNKFLPYARNLHEYEKKTDDQIALALEEKGLNLEEIRMVLEHYQTVKWINPEAINDPEGFTAMIEEEGKKEANNDILYGALWFFGGIIATVADFGYIFWGAILFGGIQMVQGMLAR